MPVPPTAPDEVIASCSFCGKANTEVNTMVAGPGVFICNECVDLSTSIVAATADTASEERSRLRAQARDRSTEDILGMLPALARGAERAEAELARWVGRGRDKGASWHEIADVLGTSVEDARRRFGPIPPA